MTRSFAIAVVSLGLWAAGVAAQGGGAPRVTALNAIQSLDFGWVVPGVPDRIAPTDIGRRAELELEGRGSLDLVLLYPDALASADGVEIPLRVSQGDVIFIDGPGSNPEYLDPTAANRVTLRNKSTGRLFLGGMLEPARDLLADTYTGTIQVLLSTPGT